jgi:type IV pilus assembly protein PilY1
MGARAARRGAGCVWLGFIGAALAQGTPPSAPLPERFAAPVISDMPLTLGGNLQPNIMLLLNTGSIGHYGYLPTNADRYHPTGSSISAASPQDRAYRSSHINKIYYDPSVEYKKPYGKNPKTGKDFIDADFHAAPIDGFGVLSTGTRRLSDNFRVTHYQRNFPNNTGLNANGTVRDADDTGAFSNGDAGNPPEYSADGDSVKIGKRAHYNRYDNSRPYCRYNRGWNGELTEDFRYLGNFSGSTMRPTGYGDGRWIWNNAPASHRDYEKLRRHYMNCFEPILVGSARDLDSYYTYSCRSEKEQNPGTAARPLPPLAKPEWYNPASEKQCSGWWKESERGRRITAADKRQNFANWYSYYYHPASMMKSVLSHTLNDLDPDVRIGYAVSGCSDSCNNTGGNAASNPRHRDNIGDGGGNVVIDGMTTTGYVKRGVRPFRDFPMNDPSGYASLAGACPYGQCKTQLLNWLFGLSSANTDFAGYATLRMSLQAVGEYYQNYTPTGPWSTTPGINRAANLGRNIPATRIQACRKSYVMVMAGGNFSANLPVSARQAGNADNEDGMPILHADKNKPPYKYVPLLPFRDAYSNTLADFAMKYWKTDLMPTAPNNVPIGTSDPAFWQHLNVLAIHLDTDANSVNRNVILRGMMNPHLLNTPGYHDPNAQPPYNVYNNTWGYPGAPYAARCNIGANGCPRPPLSGWGNPNQSDREEQPRNLLNGDDLMHAAVNSYGYYASTLNPSEISDLIKQGLGFVRKDNAVSLSATSTNTGSSRPPMLYQASFNDDWNGKLLGNRICTAADVARDYVYDPRKSQVTIAQNDSRCREEGALWFKAAWDAGKRLQAQTRPGQRNILAWNAEKNRAISFAVAEFSAAQKAEFCESASCAAEVAYFYGDGANEQRNGGPWRSRQNAFKTDETVDRNAIAGVPDKTPRVLGDIVNSSSLFVGRDDFGWASFGGVNSAMRQAYRQRKAVPRTEALYVGANDGMLHAFNAAPDPSQGGRELFAYVPAAVWHKLSALRQADYTHRFYVDGSPVVGDAWLANQWKTVLLASTGAGGSGYFALDVENPDAFGVSNVLWDIRGPTIEIRHSGSTASKVITAAPYTPGFVDLGYSIGQGSVVALKSGVVGQPDWVAVLPNGYNSYLDRPMLYIVDLKTGAIRTDLKDHLGLVNYTTADTGRPSEGPSKPNGLSTPIVVDLNRDGIADAIYAGDLRGNLWRFRLNGNGALKVETEKLFTATDPEGRVQPITARPEVGRDRSGHVMVYFGTGQYLASADRANRNIQSFYGVRDLCALGTETGCGGSSGALSRGNLLKQEIVLQEDRAYATRGEHYNEAVRVLSNHQMTGSEHGFYFDLRVSGQAAEQGERVIHTPILWSDRLIFNTIIPGDDECEPDGEGWMYEIDPSDGSQLAFTVFDLDHDGQFGDKNDLSKGGQTVSGKRIGMGGGLTARGDTKFHSNSKGKVSSIKNNKHPNMGRKSWRQLR